MYKSTDRNPKQHQKRRHIWKSNDLRLLNAQNRSGERARTERQGIVGLGRAVLQRGFVVVRESVSVRAALFEVAQVLDPRRGASLRLVERSRAAVRGVVPITIQIGTAAGQATDDAAVAVLLLKLARASVVKVVRAVRNGAVVSIDAGRKVRAVDHGDVVRVLTTQSPFSERGGRNPRSALLRALEPPVAASSITLLRVRNVSAEIAAGARPDTPTVPVFWHADRLRGAGSSFPAGGGVRDGVTSTGGCKDSRPDGKWAVVLNGDGTTGDDGGSHGGRKSQPDSLHHSGRGVEEIGRAHV